MSKRYRIITTVRVSDPTLLMRHAQALADYWEKDEKIHSSRQALATALSLSVEFDGPIESRELLEIGVEVTDSYCEHYPD